MKFPISIKNEIIIVIIALIIGILSQSDALINKYVINDDARQYIYKRFSTASLILMSVLFFDAHYGIGLIRVEHYKGLTEYIHTLQKDLMIAGHPTMVNNIPILSGRSVFVSLETTNHHAFMKNPI